MSKMVFKNEWIDTQGRGDTYHTYQQFSLQETASIDLVRKMPAEEGANLHGGDHWQVRFHNRDTLFSQEEFILPGEEDLKPLHSTVTVTDKKPKEDDNQARFESGEYSVLFERDVQSPSGETKTAYEIRDYAVEQLELDTHYPTPTVNIDVKKIEHFDDAGEALQALTSKDYAMRDAAKRNQKYVRDTFHGNKPLLALKEQDKVHNKNTFDVKHNWPGEELTGSFTPAKPRSFLWFKY